MWENEDAPDVPTDRVGIILAIALLAIFWGAVAVCISQQ